VQVALERRPNVGRMLIVQVFDGVVVVDVVIVLDCSLVVDAAEGRNAGEGEQTTVVVVDMAEAWTIDLQAC